MDCSKSLVVGITLLVLGLCSQLSLTVSSVQSGDSTSDQCGVFGWTVPSPPEDAKLVQVHTVIRLVCVVDFIFCTFVVNGWHCVNLSQVQFDSRWLVNPVGMVTAPLGQGIIAGQKTAQCGIAT